MCCPSNTRKHPEPPSPPQGLLLSLEQSCSSHRPWPWPKGKQALMTVSTMRRVWCWTGVICRPNIFNRPLILGFLFACLPCFWGGRKQCHQIRSVAQSCPTLCDPMNRSTPGLPVHHQLPEFTETHVHRVSDALQPCHPLLSPSPPAPNPSQHQSLFQWVDSLHEVAKVLEFPLTQPQLLAPLPNAWLGLFLYSTNVQYSLPNIFWYQIHSAFMSWVRGTFHIHPSTLYVYCM